MCGKGLHACLTHRGRRVGVRSQQVLPLSAPFTVFITFENTRGSGFTV